MIIEKVSIENYRNFGNFEIELKRFNLIIGENNIGKTNLLNALGLIFSPDMTFTQKRSLEVDDINYDAVQNFKKDVEQATKFEDLKGKFPEVKIEVVLSGFNPDQEAIVGDWFTGEWNTDVSKNKAKITYLFLINYTKNIEEWFQKKKESLSKKGVESVDIIDFPISHYSYSIFGGDDRTKRIDYYWLGFLRMEFLDALRDAKTQLSAGGRYTLLNKVLTVQTDNKIDEIKTKLFELKESIKSQDSAFSGIAKNIEDFLKRISIENSESNLKFDFLGVESADLLKKISLMYGTNPMDIERNGLGRNNLLYISLLLSQLMQQVDKKEKKVFFRLIGIEEPEAHLHPHLQVHLSRNINTETSDERQVIITSHSANITSQLSLDDTIVLYRDENDRKVKPYYLFRNLPPESKNYLSRFLDATKSTMFFARKILLVEGIAEQLLIPEFFKLADKEETLEQRGVSLISVNGVAFSHFLEVVKAGYFVKSVAFTDSDITKKTSERAIDLQKKYDSEIIKVKITQSETFEKEIIGCNKNGIGKKLLFQALNKTKKENGPKLQQKTGDGDIDVDEFFSEIEKYKAEFAMNLLEVLRDEQNKDMISKFGIPKYIKDGFTHLTETNG